MNWDSREPAIYILLVDIALARPQIAVSAGLATNLTGWRAQAEGYLDGILAGETNRPYFTKGTPSKGFCSSCENEFACLLNMHTSFRSSFVV
jgi:hypothetical protein